MANIPGTIGNDTLIGTPQDDIITTLSGTDTVTADAGDDVIIVDENGQGTIDGGAGDDTVQITSDGWGYAYYDVFNGLAYMGTNVGQYIISNVESVEGYGTDGTLNYYLGIGGAGADTLDASLTNAAFQSALFGLDGNDILIGGNSYTELQGGDGNDTITFGSGGGFAAGGAGADIITAGSGFDSIGYSGSSAGITIDLLSGAAGIGGDAQGDTFSGQFEAAFGSQYADNITGGTGNESIYAEDGNDIINGGDGDDVLNGGGGSDAMTGGNGDDVFQYYNYDYNNEIADTITDFAIGDKLEFQQGSINGNYVLPIFIGTDAFNSIAGEMRYEKTGGQTLIHVDLDGDSTADQTLTLSNGEHDLIAINAQSYKFDLVIDTSISGTAGNDILNGTPGNDIIFGLDGNDTITTFTGNDQIDGGGDDDLIIVDEGGSGSIDGGAGYDTLQLTSDSYGYSYFDSFGSIGYLYTSIGTYNFENIERVEAFDTSSTLTYLTLFGDSGADVLDGSSENPIYELTLYGLGGNDTLTAGSVYSYLYGGDGDDTLTSGSSYANLYGGDGDDTLTSGSGGAAFIGGLGADTITAGSGYDNLWYSDSVTGITIDLSGVNPNLGGDAQGDILSGHFEYVAGSYYDDDITGSDLGEEIEGSFGDDTIDGRDGNDTLIGSSGSDTLTGGLGADDFTFWEYQNAFSDEITDFEIGDDITLQFAFFDGNYTLPTFIGTAAFSGVAGEMRYEKTGGQTLIHLDTNGDMTANETLTLSNGEFDLIANASSSQIQLSIPNVITPNLVTTISDEIAEDTDLQTQGNDGTGLSLREAIAISNTDAAADTLTYDSAVLANVLINTSPNGTMVVSEDLTLSSGISIFHEADNHVFEISNGATVINNADIFTDNSNSTQFPNFGNGISLTDDGTTFTNTGTISTNSFGPNNEDRGTSITIEGTNATVNNAAGAFIVSQGRYAIFSYDFDDITGDYAPDFLTINNDGTLEATDDTIRIGTGEINNTGIIRSTGEIDFGGQWTPAGFASDGIAVVNDLDANFVPGPDGVTVINNSATGLIEGPRAGINFSGGGTINNAGTITGETTGFFTQGFHDFSNIFILNNSGTVSAGSGDYGLNIAEYRGGVTVFGGLDTAEINNSGTIQSGYYGIYSREGIDITNTATGQIIGDTDGSGDDDVSFYGSQEADFEVEGSSGFASPFAGTNFYSSQNITLNANGQIEISGVAYNVPNFQIEVIYLSNVDAPAIFPLIDVAATQADPNGNVVFQTDANGVVFPASISLIVPTFGTLNVAISSGQIVTVTDTSGNTVYAVDSAIDYGNSIDNSGFMSGDVITGLGNDTIINRGNIADDIYLGEGNDNYTAGAAGLSGDIYGGDGNDVVNARSGNQAIFGEDGNDFLRGGEGNDSLHGGFGVDYLRGGEGADVLNGFAGQDWADYITSSAGVTVDLLAGVGMGGEAQGDTYLFIERVYGSNHADSITGDNGLNYLRGAGGDDMLFGSGGTDYLQGDAGADALDGGAGGDYAYYASSTIGLTIDLGNPSNSTGEAAGDTYVSIENIVGSRYDDIIIGDSANNFLRGLQGVDQIFGGGGDDFLRGDQDADSLDGGAGNDWAYYATSNAAVTVDLSAGTASGGHAAGDSFTSIERVFGSVFGDSISGDSGNNYLRGFSGNDTLMGGAGIDFLQGDAGADVLNGGAGTDWAYYLSSNTGLTIDLSNSANNTGEAAGDTYISIESVIGSRYDDIMIGDSGNNYLRGFTGDDIIDGGAGNDTLRGDSGIDTFIFAVGGGNDVVIDWSDVSDFLDLTSFGFSDVNDALSYAMDTVGGDVVFNINGDIITIEDTTTTDIMDNLII